MTTTELTTASVAQQIYAVREAIDVGLANASDFELVEFFRQNQEILNKLENNDEFIERVALAEDRINATKADKAIEAELSRQEAEAPKLSTEDFRARNRARLAEILRMNRFEMAADYVESDIESLNGRESAEAMTAIRWAIEHKGASAGKENWTKVAWAIFHQIRLHGEVISEESVINFICPLITVFTTLMGSESVSESICKGAEQTIARAKPANEWSQWAKDTLSRLMSAENANNPVSDFLRDNPESAKVATGVEELISHLQNSIRSAIVRHREANQKRKLQREAGRRANQLARAAESCKKQVTKSGKKNQNKKGKK